MVGSGTPLEVDNVTLTLSIIGPQLLPDGDKLVNAKVALIPDATKLKLSGIQTSAPRVCPLGLIEKS